MKLSINTYHQRGETIIAQNLLGYKYEESKRLSALSGYAGLPVFLDFLCGLQIDKVMRQELDTSEHTDCLWKPSEIVTRAFYDLFIIYPQDWNHP